MAFNIMRTYKHEETEVDRLVLTTDENTTLFQLLLLAFFFFLSLFALFSFQILRNAFHSFILFLKV